MNQMEKIQALKKEKDAAILAHYYVPEEVQEAADYIGDSYYLARLASSLKEKTLVFCGVSFMGESAKALNPGKTVLMPDIGADCPMAHMAQPEKIKEIKETTEDVAVVCYVNSTAQLKACADVCVTSSNAVKIVKALPQKRICFIPDEHLGRHIAALLPEKEFIFNEGFCPVHASLASADVAKARDAHPGALVLAHPECKKEVLEMADFIGSTSEIISYASNSSYDEFIICTEEGVLYELKQKNPDKKFYTPSCPMCCADMKKNSLENIIRVLETRENEVVLSKELAEKSKKPLDAMLRLAQAKEGEER